MSKIRRSLLFVWQSAPGLTIARVTLVILQGLLPLANLYLTKIVVDTITNSLKAPDKQAAFTQIMLMLGVAGVVVLVSMLCDSVTEFVNTEQSQRVRDYMEGILHAKAIEVDLEHYENAEYYDMLQRAQEQGPSQPNQVLDRIAQVAQQSISLIGMLGLLLSFHWCIVGVLFVAALPAVQVRLKYADIVYRWERDRTPIRRRANYYNALITNDRCAKEIRLFNLGHLFSKRFRHLRWQLYRERFAISKRRSVANFFAQILAGLVVIFAYSFVIFETIHGKFSLGDLALFHQTFRRGQAAFQGLLGSLASLKEDKLFLNNLYEFLDLKPILIDPPHPKPFPRPIRKGIVFENVSFQYGTTTRQALNHISLSINPGETIALVGQNGSGKTTLIKLLCRLYEPTTGRITIDGIDIKNFAIADLRQQISVIFQDYVKYHLSAQENIWLGNIDISPTDDQISKAAYHSGADEVIKTLPQGYDTMLGKLFDQGEQLSIGQWQKVALARAFLRESQIIVLDEPTSSMDPNAEEEVFKKFRQLLQGQTAILISHRLSTVKMADRIYVLERGQIVESGTHEKLIKIGGVYAHLFELQAKNYR